MIRLSFLFRVDECYDAIKVVTEFAFEDEDFLARRKILFLAVDRVLDFWSLRYFA